MIALDFPVAKLPETTYRQKRAGRISSVLMPLLFRVRSSVSMRLWGYTAFVLMSLLSASFYPVAQPALDRIDTAIFVAVQMLWLLPPALFLLLWLRRQITRKAVLHGFVAGSGMGIALLCLTLAMKDTSIVETAMFSCMNGVIVVLLSWFLFRRRVQSLTWLACLFSLVSIVVFLCISDMHWSGDLLAFTGGLLLTGYSFLIEKFGFRPEEPTNSSRRVVLGVQWLTMVGVTLLFALLFGDWHAVHFHLPSDLVIFSYVSLATILLPMTIMIVMRRYVNGVTITFLALIEPIAAACFAFFVVHERFQPLVSVGGILAIGSMVLQALASSKNMPSSFSHDGLRKWGKILHLRKERERVAWADAFENWLSASKTVPLGRRARVLLQQLWYRSDGVDLLTLQYLTGIPCGCLYRLLTSLQKQGYIVSFSDADAARWYRLHLTHRQRMVYIVGS